MPVTNELRHLELYLNDIMHGEDNLQTSSVLYEKVQYNATIIPRLYLMITGMNAHVPEEMHENPVLKQLLNGLTFAKYRDIKWSFSLSNGGYGFPLNLYFICSISTKFYFRRILPR